MKLLITTFSLLFISFYGHSQVCQGNFLTDSLNDLSNWSTAGVQTTPGSANPPGTLQINTNKGRLEFLAFKSRQTYRLQRPLGCSLHESDTWTADFQFIIKSTAFNEVACLFVLTEDTRHWQSDVPGGGPSDFNTNDAIAFFIQDSSHISGQAQAMQGFVYGKKDSIINSTQTVAIDLSRDVDYYTRMQRINPSTIKLSIYDDSLRKNHVNNSPVLIQIDSTIGNLNYLQFATMTNSAGGFRSSYVLGYDYNIYEGLSVGISETKSTSSEIYKIGPNPTTKELYVRQPTSKTMSVRVFSNLGKEVYRNDNHNDLELKIDVEQFKSGLYFVEITNDHGRVVEKVIIN